VGDDTLFLARVQHILAESVKALPEQDRAERIAWCRRTGQHGVRAYPAPDCIRFEWGGRTLAVVDRDVFADGAYLEPLQMTFSRAVPDDPRELT
jgi:hypothetical protein